MYARTIIAGRLGGDPETRYTPDGKAVCSFNVATSTAKDVTVWYRVTAWEKLAELANQYLHKGDPVLVEGTMKEPKPYQAKSGEWRASLDLTATGLRFLGKKEG